MHVAAPLRGAGICWHGEPLRSNRVKRELAWVLGICCEAIRYDKEGSLRVLFFNGTASQQFTMPADPQGGGLSHALRLNFSFTEK